MTPVNNVTNITSENRYSRSINLRNYIRNNSLNTNANLSIHDLNITTLPDSIRQFQNIDTIYISNTPITSLPDSIGDLRNLEQIVLINTSIQSLPESMGQLPLESLTISNAPISALPDSIGNINNLSLSLTNTSITSLPNTVRNLSSISSNPPIPLSPELAQHMEERRQVQLTRIRLIIDQQFRLPRNLRNSTTRPIPSRRNGIPSSRNFYIQPKPISFPSSIEKLYTSINKPFREFTKIQNIRSITEWLDRILLSKNNTIFAFFIIEILEFAEKSHEFRERLALNIQASLGACDDRISFYINHIYIEKKLFSINRANSFDLIHFLLHLAFPISLIDTIAAQKSISIGVNQRERHYKEEIETYLAYLTGLNTKLSLRLPIKTMLFERISKVSVADIDSAAKLIREKMRNAKEYIPFLIEHPAWIEFLQNTYPKEMDEIGEKAVDIIDMDNKSSSNLMDCAEQAKIFRNNYLALLTQNHINELKGTT